MGTEESRNHYLSDSPIEDVDKDDFRHQEYVDTLERMVEYVDPPWNIGVFGEWGAGKTSIIRMLYSRLQDGETDYVCVEFDAWKHAEGSIRTDLLLNLDQAIGKKTDQTDEEGNDAVLGEDRIMWELYDIEEEQLGTDLSAWEEAERIITESPLVGGTTLLILGIIIVGAVVNLLNIVGLVEIMDQTISSINAVLSAFLFPLFISVFVFMAGEVRKVTTALRQKHPRKEWSGAYEKLFDNILEQTDADKVLISIDNLDRCESDTVYDVLVSLKTFLQSQDCIYIIPCDDQALQSHIESINTDGDYFEEQTNEREFLRKFFQDNIRIPDFIDEDIEEYAMSQNQKLAMPFDDSVLDIITKAYVQNPRRIKRSLNRLTTLRILSEQMEEAGHLDEGKLTENLDFLAKIMILQDDHPSFYSELQDDPRLLEEANDYFRGDLLDRERKERIKRLLWNSEDGSRSETELERFLRSTLRCTVDNPQAFFQLGEPSFARELSNRNAFIQNLRTNQGDDIRKEIQTVEQENQQITPYLTTIETTLDNYVQQGREGPLFSIISTLVAVFDELEEETQESLARVLGEYLVLDQVRDFYTDFDPNEFFPVVLKISDPEQTTVFEQFAATVVTDNELRENVLEVFVENAEEVPRKAAESLCSSLLDLDDNEFKSVLDTLSRSEVSKRLATPDLLERASAFVTWSESRRTRFEKTKHYKQFDSQAQPRGRRYFVEKLLDLKVDMDQYYTELVRELSELDGQVTSDTGSRLFREVRQRVSVPVRDPDIVKIAINFYESYDSTTRENFHNWIHSILDQWDQEDIQQIISHVSKQDMDILNDKQVVDTVLDRVPEQLNDADWVVEILIPAIPGKFDEQLFGMVKRLSKDNDHAQSVIAAQIFSEYPGRFEMVQNTILECCQRQISSASTYQTKTYLRAEAAAYNGLEDSYKKKFIKRWNSLLSGDRKDPQAFEDIWNRIKDKIEPDRRATVTKNIRNHLQSELSGEPDDNRFFLLVDVFSSLVQTGAVDEDDGEWVVECLSATFEGSKLNNNQVSILIDKLAEFSEYYGREEQILKRVENLIEENNDDWIHENTKHLLDAFEETKEIDENRLKEVREKLENNSIV